MRHSSWNAVWAALWCVALFFGLNVVMVALVAVAGPMPGIVPRGIAHLLIVGAFVHLVLVSHEVRPASGWSLAAALRALGLGPAQPIQLLVGVLIGLSIKLPADLLRSAIEARWPTPEVQLAAQAELLRHETVGQTVALLAFIGLIGPLLEEAYYRGVAFRLFERGAGRSVALIATSAFFALSHASPRDWLPLFVVALVLGQARANSGRAWAAVAAHISFNSSALVFAFWDYSLADSGAASRWLFLVGGALCSAALLAVLARAAD